jgi:hypothetical protein
MTTYICNLCDFACTKLSEFFRFHLMEDHLEDLVKRGIMDIREEGA